MEVILDRAWTDEHLGSDLNVGASLGHKLCHSRFLRRQAYIRFRRPLARPLPRGAQFDTRPFGITLATKVREESVGDAQLLSGIRRATLAAEPFTEEKVGPGEV